MSGGPEMEEKKGMDAVEVGMVDTFTKTVTETDVYAFAGITGDFYAMHVDEEFAKKSRFGTRIAHGALLIGFISAAVSRINGRIPSPGGVYYYNEFKFIAPVKFGDTITTEAKVIEKNMERREVIYQGLCTNQRGEKVLEGKAIVKVLKETS
jgi:3-hydroxybutyryl-CoA dehydratase